MNSVQKDNYLQPLTTYMEDLTIKIINMTDQQKNFKNFSKKKKTGFKIVKGIPI